MTVVNLDAERDRRQSEAWDRYATARRRADETLTFVDGQAAAKAWRDFIDLCMSSEQTGFVRGSVTRLERRA